MTAILGFLAKLSVILGFIGIAFSSISDILFKTTYLDQLDSAVDLSNFNVKILVGVVAVIVPETGAYTTPSKGQIPRPCPNLLNILKIKK